MPGDLPAAAVRLPGYLAADGGIAPQRVTGPQVDCPEGKFWQLTSDVPSACSTTVRVPGGKAPRAAGGHGWALHHEGSFLPPAPRLMSSTAAAATHCAMALPVVWRSCPALLVSPDTPP